MPSPDDERLRTTSGSRARDHLANERTWLAWIRTGLNTIILGMAVARFLPVRNAYSAAAGILIAAVGAVCVIFGTIRYRTVSRELEHGFFLTGSRGRMAVVASALLLVVLGIAFILLLV